MNTNTAIMRQLMRTARTLEAEWRQVLWGSMGTGTRKDESSSGLVWTAVTARSHLAGVLKLTNYLFFNYFILLWGRSAVLNRG
jgi:hypothetical protein